jgi:hypothetical protein
MQNIKLEELDLVTGGTGTTANTPPVQFGSGTGASSTACQGGDALMTSLNSISSSIKDLSNKNNNGGLFGGGDSMLMLGMALAMRRSDTVVVNGGGGCCHGGGGYYWRQSW